MAATHAVDVLANPEVCSMVCDFLADDTVRVRLIWLCKPTYCPGISLCLAAAWDSLDGWLADCHYEATEYAALCRMWQAIEDENNGLLHSSNYPCEWDDA
jgi:hypothetical protein